MGEAKHRSEKKRGIRMGLGTQQEQFNKAYVRAIVVQAEFNPSELGVYGDSVIWSLVIVFSC
ncbi:hypothetical protein [Herbaspirillum lusitanum]|uniref:hypothetical protein n=1 Tax=Herbaspirillum lusitanum TaxID=213312 RepID=UPI0012F5071E|nr:hypothetical protein [Herbaspirillum lusitanum]